MSPGNGLRDCLRFWLEVGGVKRHRSFGLNGLDHALAEYITFRDGFFVEAGANDGVSQSNTLYFERYRGWRGLLIEPIPELAVKCKMNRSRAFVEQCALVAKDLPKGTVDMRYCNLMSLVQGARGSRECDDAHIQAGRSFLRPDEDAYTVTVPARTLMSVLETHRVLSIDLLSLDVEGYEAEVLKGLDFDRLAPRFVLVEANDRIAVERVLGNRYEHVANLSHHDRLYKHRKRGS